MGKYLKRAYERISNALRESKKGKIRGCSVEKSTERYQAIAIGISQPDCEGLKVLKEKGTSNNNKSEEGE